ncbi:acyltransferase family protein [Mucilaginibacter glaciei]|uniref:Acyltransferase n=1 Tax=Mucilaginibacter glaciei TaxID=2772109 RepID=A0A926NLR0_9SPHI|nr:acyltransferase [Mucilaginibacter glaciei]MBD1391533.1 acyltransferase [Mucilaginibacter glaciei]
MIQTPDPKTPTLSQVLNESYYPSLNGLRGVAIVLVVASHLNISGNVLINGQLGVDLFFVLSGFLITTLCLKELNNTGSLSLKSFYARRSLRIFPVAYLYLIVLLVLNISFSLAIPGFQFAGAALYLMNFNYFRAHNFTWLVAHFWSLSVEEQFYVIFPFLLKINRRFFFIAIAFIVLGLPILCSLQFFFKPLNQGIFYAFTHYLIKFQGIAIGCLFSVLTMRKVFDHQMLIKTKTLGNLAAIILIVYLKFDDFYSIKAVFINGIISFLIGYLIISNLNSSSNVIYKILNFKPLAFIGIISYSIYIWQQIFTSSNPNLSKYVISYPYNLIWIAIVPCLSYFFYERYFLKLKRKLKKIN